MLPAAHRAHYLSVTAGLLLNELHGSGIRDEAHARISALAEQINEIAGLLRDELTNGNDSVFPDEPPASGDNVVSLPWRAARHG